MSLTTDPCRPSPTVKSVGSSRHDATMSDSSPMSYEPFLMRDMSNRQLTWELHLTVEYRLNFDLP